MRTSKTTGARKPRSKKKYSLIPVLFTLGIIGWGFFAIDRLTRPMAENNELYTHSSDLPHKAAENAKAKPEPSWKNRVLGLIQEIESTRKTEKAATQAETLEIAGADPLAASNFQPVEMPEAEKAPATTVRLYFYQFEDEKDPVLKPVNRQVGSSQDKLQQTFELLIKGPDLKEKTQNLLDTFPLKPALKNVQQQKNLLVLDFDDRFGMAATHEMIRYQLAQLLQTAVQFRGIESIRITINGKMVRQLGGDGMQIPETINRREFPELPI